MPPRKLQQIQINEKDIEEKERSLLETEAWSFDRSWYLRSSHMTGSVQRRRCKRARPVKLKKGLRSWLPLSHFSAPSYVAHIECEQLPKIPRWESLQIKWFWKPPGFCTNSQDSGTICRIYAISKSSRDLSTRAPQEPYWVSIQDSKKDAFEGTGKINIFLQMPFAGT